MRNAAEAMPMPEPQDDETELKRSDLEEIEDLTEEAKEVPKKPEIEDLTHETEEAKDDARWNKMYKEIAPDMTADAHEIDPADEARYKAAREALDAVPDRREIMPPSPPPIPEAKKKPSIWKRLFGRKG